MSNLNILVDGEQTATLAVATGSSAVQVSGFDIYSDEGNIRVGNTIYVQVTPASGVLGFTLISATDSALTGSVTDLYTAPDTSGTAKVTIAFPIPDTLAQQFIGIRFDGTVGTTANNDVDAIFWDQK